MKKNAASRGRKSSTGSANRNQSCELSVTFGNKLETPKADSVLIVPVLPKKDSASSSSKKKPSPQVEGLSLAKSH